MPDIDISEEIHRFREKLLDLTNRNRLLNYRKSKRRTVEIFDELPNEIYKRLVENVKPFKFDHQPDADDESNKINSVATEDLTVSQLSLPMAPTGEKLPEKKHTDDRLQTNLSEDRLETVLKSIAREAKTAIEETGINYLHLAIGMLRWSESENSEKEYLAPLLLIPIHIDRNFDARRGRYAYNAFWTEEGVKFNLSLAKRLERDFGLILPDFDQDSTPEQYFVTVAEATRNQPSWTVLREAVIGFFSFHKLMMYEDIDPANWGLNGKIDGDSIAEKIIAGGDLELGEHIDSLYARDYEIDSNQLATSMLLPSEADSSQHSALCDIAEGKSLVIEGPPGTGKSQTITNAIAMAMYSGKRILFVAEKLAALEVVRKKLEGMGLGEFCLELHSDVASPRRVFESIRSRLESTFVDPGKLRRLQEEIEDKQSTIGEYLEETEKLCGPYEEPLYELFWRVIEFRSDQIEPLRSIDCDSSVDTLRFKRNSQTLESFVNALAEFPNPEKSPWWGFWATDVNPNHCDPVDDVLATLEQLSTNLVEAIESVEHFSGDKSMWHDLFAGVDLSVLEELAATKVEQTNDLDLLLDPNAQAVAKELSDEVERRASLKQEIAPMFFGDFDHGIVQCGKLRAVLNTDHARLFKNKSFKNIESYRVWLSTTRKAIEELEEYAVGLESLGYGPVRNAEEYDAAVYLRQLFRHPAVEDASVVRKDLFLNSALSEYRRGKKKHDSLIEFQASLEEAFHLASVPGKDEVVEIAKAIRPHTSSMLRFLSSQYRKGVAQLKTFWRPGIGARPAMWLANLESLLKFEEDKKNFSNDTKLIRLFGDAFKGVDTDWERIKELLTWVNTAKKQGLDAGKVIDFFRIRDEKNDHVSSSIIKRSLKSFRAQLRDEKKLAPLGITSRDLSTFAFSDISIRIDSLLEWVDQLFEGSEHLQRSKLGSLTESLNFDDKVIAFERADSFISDKTGRVSMIGDWFKGLETDSQSLRSAVNWCQRLGSLNIPTEVTREIIASSPTENCSEIASLAGKYRTTLANWRSTREELEKFGRSSKTWLNFDSTTSVDFGCLEKLGQLRAKIRKLPSWASFSREIERCNRAGLTEFAKGVLDSDIKSDQVSKVYQATVLNCIAEQALNDSDLLRSFSRQELESARRNYRQLDQEITTLNQQRIAYESSRVSPPAGNSRGKVAEKTEMGLILHEVQKQQRHCKIRDLLFRAGNSVQALKPCFMMSPLSVAQFIAPESIEFDLVVMDEASQIKPEDALGTIFRAKQIVIVGDPKQLPPTSFFDRTNDEVSDEEATQFDNSESILEAAMKTFQPVRRLRWHYRSQHESLIQFSNHRFYDDDLVVFPSPTAESGKLGIRYHEIEDASFKGGQNLAEAEAVADAIVKHVLERSDETLGVGAFNMKQSRLIEELVDKRCEQDSRVQVAIDEFRDKHEGLFIKNLENLQGDERDVIFIAFTYGPDPQSGRLMNRFGPINGAAGWRRLNVLITRARKRVEVFSSMLPSQIAGGPGKSKGVNALKDYLEFARTGMLPDRGDFTGREPDSPFEVSVARVVEAMGLVAVPQVGVAGYFIDLGVRERDGNGDFILGIECDGATYHSSKSARDRDRLREEVIRSRGWKLHRIWSTDWFLNQKHEEERLKAMLCELARANSDDLQL